MGADKLRFGFMPYITAVDLIQKYMPLMEYMEQELALPIDFYVTKDYYELIDSLGASEEEAKFDVVFFGGFPYINTVTKYGKKRIIARWEVQHKPSFHAVIFVSNNSKLQSLEQLKAHRFAFGSKNSTLSSLVPRYMLQQAGVGLEQLEHYHHLQNHEDVVLGVLLGSYQAGAVAQEVFNQYQLRYPIRALAFSQPLSTHVFVASNYLADDIYVKIQAILFNLNVNNPDAKTILSSISPDLTGFVAAEDSDYDLHRQIAAQITD